MIFQTMNSSSTFVFGIHAFDSFLRVECANSEIRAMLERYIFPPLPRSMSFAAAPDISLWVEQGPHEFRVLINHELVALAASVGDATLAAVKALDDAVIQRLHGFRAVHAGAVIVDGSALILPGSTHAGKSTLVAELLRRGASHLSDEYALIDGQGFVHAYPRPLLLRDGDRPQSLTLPTDLNASFAAGRSAPVRWIFAAGFAPGSIWDIHETSQGEAVMLLLRNTPHQIERSPEIVDLFFRVASKAVCYEGTRCDAIEAVDRILDIVCRK